MPGEFFVTGFAAQLLADPGAVQKSSELAGLTGQFISNIPRGQPIPITGGLVWVPPRDFIIGDDGDFYEMLPDGTVKETPGITLTAHDPAFELSDPLQWRVKPDRFNLAGSTAAAPIRSWWFNAPAPGWSGTIDQLTPVPGVLQLATRGLRSQLVMVPETDPPLYFWQDEDGNQWSDPKPYSEIFADSVARAVTPALDEAIPPNAAAYFATLSPEIIADPDNPSTHVRLKIGDAVGPARPGTATTIDLVTDAEVTGKDLVRSGTASAARSVLDVPSLVRQVTRGRAVIMLDDGFASHVWAMAEAEKRGQRLNLALTQDFIGTGGKMNSSQVRQARQCGNGILLHTKTHPNLTTVDMATLINEMALPQRQFGSLVGKPLDRSDMDFVYSQSARNATTLSTGYLRYRRQFAGRFGTEPWRTKWYRPKPHLCGRFNWDSVSRHEIMKAEIIAAAAADEDIVFYTHATDAASPETAGNGVTPEHFLEVLDLLMRLGMRAITVDEFCTTGRSSGLNEYFGLIDPSFENVAGFAANFTVASTGGTNLAEIATTTIADGVVGAHALHLNRTVTAAGNCIVTQTTPIPTAAWIEAGASVVLAARVKTAFTTVNAGGGLDLRIVGCNADGTVGDGSGGASAVSARYTGTDWSSPGSFRTAEWTGYLNSPYFTIQARQVNALGDSWVDHVQLSMGLNDSVA